MNLKKTNKQEMELRAGFDAELLAHGHSCTVGTTPGELRIGINQKTNSKDYIKGNGRLAGVAETSCNNSSQCFVSVQVMSARAYKKVPNAENIERWRTHAPCHATCRARAREAVEGLSTAPVERRKVTEEEVRVKKMSTPVAGIVSARPSRPRPRVEPERLLPQHVGAALPMCWCTSSSRRVR